MNLFGNVNLLGWFADANSGGTVTGSGTPNTIPLWTAASVLGDSKITQAAGGTSIAFTPTANTTGSTATFTLTNPNNTGRTASTEVFGLNYVSGTQTWATGAITTQREFRLSAPTYAFAGASIITDAYTFYADMPIAGSNTTFNAAWAAGFAGPVRLTDDIGALVNCDLQIDSQYSQRVLLKNNTTSNIWYLQTQSFGGGAGLDNFSIGTSSNNGLAFSAWSTAGVQTHKGNVSTSGAITNYTFTNPANTGQTASTEIPSFKYNGGSRQWATGAITTQREHYQTKTTYTAVGASVITNAYGFYVEAPTASTNITITNNYAAGFSGAVHFVLSAGASTIIGGKVGTLAQSALYLGVASGSQTSTNYALVWSGNLEINAQNTTSSIILETGGASRFTVNGSATSGSASGYLFNSTNTTGQTASTEVSTLYIPSRSRQWATGAIALQRDLYYATTTYTAVGASVITNAYGAYFEAATASTNITITNNYAAGFAGDIKIDAATAKINIGTAGSFIRDTSGLLRLATASSQNMEFAFNGTTVQLTMASALFTFSDAVNIAFNTTTGTKFGTTTGQKMGWWNATPIVQPTTAFASAVFVANAGTAVNDASTFDGYTIKQVVAALRAMGKLA